MLPSGNHRRVAAVERTIGYAKRVLSRVTIVLSLMRGLITLLIATLRPLSHDFGTSDMCCRQPLRLPSLVQAVHGVANVNALALQVTPNLNRPSWRLGSWVWGCAVWDPASVTGFLVTRFRVSSS